jgi:protein-S-isoprenylcysteine O-methyltransferase Ste14
MVVLKVSIFYVDVFLLLLLLFGAVWSIMKPDHRVWPPPGQRSWQYRITWLCFILIFVMNAFLFIFDWDSWIFHGPHRLIVGIPVTLLGALLVPWGITTLGAKNTSGLPDRFVATGPYTFTRNPQYLGDNVLFLGLSIIANSELLWIAHILLILVFLITPLTEEPWLEAQYGQEYIQYKQSTSRFL